jgi:TPR repeat protein
MMYVYGDGVSEDDKEAFKWLLKSAESGCSCAMQEVGMLYLRGIGVSKDEDEAYKWYDKMNDFYINPYI